MEHIPDIEGVVKEASRTLAKGGRFIITTYSDEFLGQLSSAIGKEMANSYNSGLTHVSLYSPEYWNDLLRKHKFTFISGVNTLFNELLRHPDFSKIDFSHLKLTIGGGMAVQTAVANTCTDLRPDILPSGMNLLETLL